MITAARFSLVTHRGLSGCCRVAILPTAASAYGLFLARQSMLGTRAI